jgi:hypothetical protein
VSRAGRGKARGLALGFLRLGGAEVSRVKADRRPSAQAMRSSLEAGGAARMLRGSRPEVSGGVGRHHDLSGCGAGQELIQCLRGGLPAQGLAGPGVQLGSDRVQVFADVPGQGHALGEILAQQPVAAALPWRVRIAEVDIQVRSQSDLRMAGHLAAQIPGQRPAELRGQRAQ